MTGQFDIYKLDFFLLLNSLLFDLFLNKNTTKSQQQQTDIVTIIYEFCVEKHRSRINFQPNK